MSKRTCLASFLALSLMIAGSSAAQAQVRERGVSDGGRAGPLAEVAPGAGAVAAGSPWVGPERATRAEIRATGAEFLAIDGPAPLHESVAEQLGAAETVLG